MITQTPKWTPGPWRVIDYAGTAKGFIAVASEHLSPAAHIADVFPFGARPGGSERILAEHLANAHLIAAAPELAEALELCVRRFQSTLDELKALLADHPIDEEQDEAANRGDEDAIAIARAALSRARGGAS